MSYRFDGALRAEIAARCAAFSRAPAGDARPDLKRAAVAITIVEADSAGEAAFILTRRAAGLRSHGGQWAIPGGRCDEGETAVDAALRELDEELALRLPPTDVLGVLDDYPTRSGYLVTPIVAWGEEDAQPTPNPAEIASVHRIPLAAIMAQDAFEFVVNPETGGRIIRFRREGGFIHAPTAALFYQFREVLAGRATRVAELEAPRFAWR